METAASTDKLYKLIEGSGIALLYVFDIRSGGLVMMHDPDRLNLTLNLPHDEDPASAILALSHDDDRQVVSEREDFLKAHHECTWMSYIRIPDGDGICRWYLLKNMVSRQEASGLPDWIVGLLVPLGRMGESHSQLKKMAWENSRLGGQALMDTLTRQEKNVAILIAKGFSYTQIAEQLHIQPVTVNTHRRNILRKLHLKNIAQIACVVAESGFLSNN
jgi:DNA-binding CsgD family transcriptional regulator